VKEAPITGNREREWLGLDVGRRTRCRGCVIGTACSAWCCEFGVNFPHSPLRKAPGIARNVGTYFLAIFIEYCRTSLLSSKFAARCGGGRESGAMAMACGSRLASPLLQDTAFTSSGAGSADVKSRLHCLRHFVTVLLLL
jgi:hypothetical protein